MTKKIHFIEMTISPNVYKHYNLNDIYNHHKLVYSLWGKRRFDESPFLFRFKKDKLFVLAHTNISPNLNNKKWIVRSKITSSGSVYLNGLYHFDIEVNPTKKINHKNVVPLKTDSDILYWLERKGQHCGFDITENISFSNKRNEYGRKGIKIFKVNIFGILKVTNPNLFTKNFIKGIGRGKRFGNGLFLLKKCY